MNCIKCGHALSEEAMFCPYCGEKVVREDLGSGAPIYTADVKGLLKSGKLIVYRDRVEFVSSSVQRTVFNYSALVAVKKGLDRILFITEDGRTESCTVNRKNIHEAFLYIEQAVRPYLEQRRERLMSEGIRYSFVSGQGLTSGVLNISEDGVEFKSKSGQVETVSYEDVRAAGGAPGTLELFLHDGRTTSFSIGKDIQDEIVAFVREAAAPYIEARREALRERGIYFSFPSSSGSDTGILNILEDRADFTGRSGQADPTDFRAVRAVRLYMGTLELALTDGTAKSFLVDKDTGDEALAFIQRAIEPYVLERTVGFATSFGIDERVEVNEERGVFHIIRQNGAEISDAFPLEDVAVCEWTESRAADGKLGGVLTSGMALFNSAAKAAGAQAAPKAEDLIRSMDLLLTIRTEQGPRKEAVRFGSFPLGMSRANRKYERYIAEATSFMDYMSARCLECEFIMPALPEPEIVPAELPAPTSGERETTLPAVQTVRELEPSPAASPAEKDQFGITKYVEGVSGFINDCTAPMTIAIQGSWGSGKNGIMNLLSDRLVERCGGNLIWFHTWQFSQFDLGEQLPMVVANRLIGQLSGTNSEAAKDRAVKVAKGLISITSGFISQGTTDGQSFSEAIFKDNSADSLEKRVRTFSSLVRKRTGEGNGKAVIFIDDLDRLTPVKGVELLEALRNFFDCEGCVFVVNVDYSFVFRGAKERYGEDFDERKGKRFFDQMFQVSFRVPSSGFNIQNYVKDKLAQFQIDSGGEAELNFYVELIKHSVGAEPKSIDHLFNSFLLLKNMDGRGIYASKDQRLMLFALLCMQTSFHDIYDSLVRMKENVTPELLQGLCGAESEVLAGIELDGGEAEAFQGFAKVFCDIINTDRTEDLSEEECRAFAEVLDFSSITSM